MNSEELWVEIACVAAHLQVVNGTVDASTPKGCQRTVSDGNSPFRLCRKSGYRTGAVTGLETVCRQRSQRMGETIKGIDGDATTSLCIKSCNRIDETSHCHGTHLRSVEAL